MGKCLLIRVALLLLLQSILTAAFCNTISIRTMSIFNDGCSSNIGNSKKRITCTQKMGLYEEDIDWDSDLFSQVGKSNNDQNSNEAQSQKEGISDDNDEKQWDMRVKSTSVKSMREQMKRSWGGGEDETKQEGKPTADWAGAGGGPNEDEPWFTG